MFCLNRVKRFLLVLSMVAIVVPSASQAYEKPGPKTSAVLKAVGASPGGVGFMILAGAAKWVKKEYPRIDITIVPGGFVGNINRVNVGEADLGSTTSSLGAMAMGKEPPYDKVDIKKSMSLFSTQNEFNFFAIVKKDFPANSINELFEKKVPAKFVTLHKGTATELVWRTVFAAKGITWEDVSKKWGGNISFVSWADGVNLVKDGHADGILAVGSKKIGWAMDLANAREVKILKWDQDLLDMVQKRFGLQLGKIPGKTYPNIDEDVTVPFSPCEIIVNADVPNKVVHAILEAMKMHEVEYSQHHKALAGFKAENMAKGTKLPLHPGAIEFYNEYNIPLP